MISYFRTAFVFISVAYKLPIESVTRPIKLALLVLVIVFTIPAANVALVVFVKS